MRKRLFPDDHRDVAKTYNNLGNAYNGMNDYNRAIEHHKLALEMNKRLFPGNHKDIALSYFNLGNSYYNMKDYKSAIEHHNLAL